MPTFRVVLYEHGKPVGAAREIVAPSEQRAAEAAAGERLVSVGNPSHFRARVWDANLMAAKATSFYRDVRGL